LPEVDQIGELDVFGIFAALHVYHPADKLFAGSPFDFEINVTGSAEISGIGSGDILAVDVEEEARECESVEQRATGGGNMATAQRSRHVVNLRLVG
jgi:hypothetical protein